MGVIKYFLQRRTIAVLVTLIVLGAGYFGWQSLSLDAFPDATNLQVMVLTKAEGLATTEVERRITLPIEQAMAGLPQVTKVRSLSRNALSQVIVVFEDGTDVYLARQWVLERLAKVEEDLPEGAEAELGPISTGLGEIYQYSLQAGYYCPDHGDIWQQEAGDCPHDGKALMKSDQTLMDLRTLQDWEVAPRLKGLAGVNEVNSFGGFVRQYHVIPQTSLLNKFGVSLGELVEALEQSNANEGGGVVEQGDEQFYVVSRGLASSKADLENIVLRSQRGTPVLVKDVASVELGSMARQGAVTRDGMGEVVAGMVIMLRGENSRDVVSAVKERMAEIQKSLPPGVKVRPFYDRTSLIDAAVGTLGEALAEGALFVVAVLFLFLWDLRGALVVALSLPLTASLVFLAMGKLGITANLMSLGGLAIAVGMVVDGSIVVVENILGARRLARNRGRPWFDVAMEATAEVARPIFYSILVIVLVMVPLFALEGIEGKMFKPMALTVILAMGASLLVALTVVPALTTLGWKKAAGTAVPNGLPETTKESLEAQVGGTAGNSAAVPGSGVGSEHDSGTETNPVQRALLAAYRPSLAWAVAHKWVTIGVSVAFLVAAAAMVPGLGTEFLPPLDEGALAVNVVRLPSASLDASVRQVSVLEEQILERFPEVETVVSKTGRPEIAEDPMGPEQNDLLIMLKPRDSWREGMTKEKMVAELNELFAESPGIRPSFSQPIALRVNELISGVKSDLAIKVYGENLDELREAAERIAPILGGIEGAEDVKVEQTSGMTEIEVVPNREKLARYGLRIGDVNQLIATAVGGRLAGKLYEGHRWFRIQVRLPASERDSTDTIERIPLVAPGGERLFLGDVVTIRRVESPAQVSREDLQRRLVVECNVRGRDLGSFVAEAQEKMAEIEASLPAGYYLDWGGQFENQQRATKRLAIVVPIALFLVILMQLSALRNVRSTLLVVLNLPFSVIGGIGVIYFTGLHISVSVLVGLIALLGMAVQHGTLLVSYVDELRARGLGVQQAVMEGSLRRLQPLLMTKLTSLLGLIPMLMLEGPGADIQRPLALVVLGGLAFTTILNLFVVPALYPLVHREK